MVSATSQNSCAPVSTVVPPKEDTLGPGANGEFWLISEHCQLQVVLALAFGFVG
jgi:hypothetical protein